MRKCNKCGETKDESDFLPSQADKKTGNRKGDGLKRVCRSCTITAQKEWFDRLPPDEKEAFKSSRIKKIMEWNNRNPAYQKAAKANLHAKRVGAKGKVSGKDVIAVWEKYGNRCWCCGCDATEIDHYRPINKKSGGTNTVDNLRPICRECNQKRSHAWHGDEIATKEAKLLKQIKKLLQGEAG